MTWRVRHWRNDSPHPVSLYCYGEHAETEARQRADELAAQPNFNRVEVDPIERRGSGGGAGFFLWDFLAAPLNGDGEKNARNPPGRSLMDACVNCDAPLPPPSPKGGRPRRFCSLQCKNRWRYEVKLERENPVRHDEEKVHAWDVQFYGREGADRRAARRRRKQEEAHRA